MPIQIFHCGRLFLRLEFPLDAGLPLQLCRPKFDSGSSVPLRSFLFFFNFGNQSKQKMRTNEDITLVYNYLALHQISFLFQKQAAPQ